MHVTCDGVTGIDDLCQDPIRSTEYLKIVPYLHVKTIEPTKWKVEYSGPGNTEKPLTR